MLCMCGFYYDFLFIFVLFGSCRGKVLLTAHARLSRKYLWIRNVFQISAFTFHIHFVARGGIWWGWWGGNCICVNKTQDLHNILKMAFSTLFWYCISNNMQGCWLSAFYMKTLLELRYLDALCEGFESFVCDKIKIFIFISTFYDQNMLQIAES